VFAVRLARRIARAPLSAERGIDHQSLRLALSTIGSEPGRRSDGRAAHARCADRGIRRLVPARRETLVKARRGF
jgi:hypothetical protein